VRFKQLVPIGVSESMSAQVIELWTKVEIAIAKPTLLTMPYRSFFRWRKFGSVANRGTSLRTGSCCAWDAAFHALTCGNSFRPSDRQRQGDILLDAAIWSSF
jgi:hypothetical protein